MHDSSLKYTELATFRLAFSLLLLAGSAAAIAQSPKSNAPVVHSPTVHGAPAIPVKEPAPKAPEPVSERREPVVVPREVQREPVGVREEPVVQPAGHSVETVSRVSPVAAEHVRSRAEPVLSKEPIEAGRSNVPVRNRVEPTAERGTVVRSQTFTSTGIETGVAGLHEPQSGLATTSGRGLASTSYLPPASLTSRPVAGLPLPFGTAHVGVRVTELSPQESKARLKQVNAERARLSGSNKMPIPMGVVRSGPEGKTFVTTAEGRSYNLRANGSIESIGEGRKRATLDAGGRLTSLYTPTLRVSSGAQGRTTITARRPDHTTLVSTGRRTGYLEREAKANGRPVVERIYVSGGRSYRRTFIRRSYMGIPVKEFQASASYSSAFGSWTSLAWPSPVAYRWRWTRDRWYGRHSAYFSVWPSYRGVNYWLTDYLLGALIMENDDPQQPDDSQTQQDAGVADATAQLSAGNSSENESIAAAAAATPISPDAKEALANEVQQEIALSSKPEVVADEDGALRPSELGQVIVPGRVFVVGAPIFVARAHEDGPVSFHSVQAFGAMDCALSPGDLLRLDRLPVPIAVSTAEVGLTSGNEAALSQYRLTTAVAEVVAGQRGDCAAGIRVSVTLPQLEEMENELRARVDDGLQAFSREQGKNGLPAAPAGALTIAAGPEATEPAVAPMLQELRSEARQAERELISVAPKPAEVTQLQ